MNVEVVSITVTLMQTVKIPKDHSSAHVKLALQEMESHAKVGHEQFINPSCTKPFSTHTFYQGGGGREVSVGPPPYYLKNRCPHHVKFCS